MAKGRKANIKRIYEAVFIVLAKHPDGLPIKQLARKSKIPAATITYHLNRGSLLNYVDEHNVGPVGKPFARIIVLKRGKSRLLGKILDEIEKE